MLINKPRGTQDLYGDNLLLYQYVIDVCKNIALNFGFRYVIIPTFEHAELFHRNNENSDIVKKELYEFKDRGNRILALRPEATASLVRFLGENKLLKTEPLPIKIYTYGSMFRYERPQNGRQREFQQFDVEIVGANSIYDVVNVISYGYTVLKKLEIIDNVKLKINYIGSFQTRIKWIKSLQKYFYKYIDKLTPLSQERLKLNPLRIFDDKVDGKLFFVKKAPKIEEFLTISEKQEFKKVLTLLDELKIKYVISSSLVRGLDYYSDVVFEFVSNFDKENELTLIGGGQYDKLVEEITGIDLKSIGLAIGTNRCAELLSSKILNQLKNKESQQICLIGLKNVDDNKLFLLTQNLQNLGINISFKSKIKEISKAIKLCERINCRYLVIVGEKELSNKIFKIKDLNLRKEIDLNFNEFEIWWKEIVSRNEYRK